MDLTRLIVYFPLVSAIAGMAAIGALLLWPIGSEKVRRRLRQTALVLAVVLASVHAGTTFTLGRRPWLFSLLLLAAFFAWIRRRKAAGRNLDVVTGVAMAVLSASGVILWGFQRPPSGCDGVAQLPGVRRLDLDPGSSSAASFLPVGMEEAAYSAALSADDRTLYVTYAHLHGPARTLQGGVARLSLDGSEAPDFLALPGRNLVRIRVHPRGGRVYALDMQEGTIFVLEDRPFRLVRRMETGAGEVCDILFDPPSNRFFVLARSGFGRTEGILIYEDSDPARLIGKFALPNIAPGASELLFLPTSPRAFIYSEGFVNLIELDWRGPMAARTAASWLPGFLDGAIGASRRELYLMNLLGFIQVWDVDRFVRKRTEYLRAGGRAVGYASGADRLYVSDYFRGDLVEVDPSTLDIVSTHRAAPRAREMAVSADGRIYLPTACGVLEANPAEWASGTGS